MSRWRWSGAREGVIGIKEKYTGVHRGARAAAARRRPAPAAARHLPGRRRVRAGLRRDRPRHPARRPAEGRGGGGRQRRDARQHRPRPARDAQVPDGGGRRSRAGDAACPGRDVDRRGDRRRRRADRAERGGAPRRRHDGAPGRRSRRADHQDARRDRRAARDTQAGGVVHGRPAADRAHRPIGVRPVPVLHRAVPALPARPPDRAAQGDAGARLHRPAPAAGGRHALLLRVQPVQPLLLPRGPRPEERLRLREAGGARGGAWPGRATRHPSTPHPLRRRAARPDAPADDEARV